jgi:3-oxoacyl-[acyl-carrier protein] reductase
MKRLLVTGVSRGVGLEFIKYQLEIGNFVYGISRTKSDDLNELSLKYPDKFYHFLGDLESYEELTKEINDYLITNKVKLNSFVNNAAIAYDDIVTNANPQKLEKMYKVNVFAPIMLTKCVIRNFILNKNKGTIVHMSSISVHTGYKGLSMYASTKGSLEAFSKNTAREWGVKGIRSNCVVAGFMETEMSRSLTKEQKDKIYNRTSLKQSTEIKSVIKTISFLTTDSSSSITGQNVFVDSGTI